MTETHHQYMVWVTIERQVIDTATSDVLEYEDVDGGTSFANTGPVFDRLEDAEDYALRLHEAAPPATIPPDLAEAIEAGDG